MKMENTKPKYFLYARKSSEAEDRQIASIDSQIAELTQVAKKNRIQIVDILSESQSAKAPGRPVFNKMIERISRGEAQGIICWKLDRLARNPIDGGQISWLLQRGILEHIQTYEKSYYPSDNVLMMSVEFGMANQFIIDLSLNTKRGLKTKAERGWYPVFAMLGYINNSLKKKGEKELICDPERFHLVRKMFDLMLTDNYSPPQILKIATEEWRLLNRNGKRIARSTIYRIFTDPFYYGVFEYPKGSGNWYQGKHKPMISEKEYDRIQLLLGRKGKPRPKKHIFSFRGLIFCGECGAMVTAEEKIKKQKNGNVHRYIYYHCTKRKNPNCSQKVVREEEIENQIMNILERIEIPPEFCKWAIEQLKTEHEKEQVDRNIILSTQQRSYNTCIQKLDNLIDMRASNLITEEEFLRKKSQLTKEKIKLHELLNDTDSRVDNWIERAEEVFHFAENARTTFQKGTLEAKRQILAALGSNSLLKDGKLSINVEKPIILMEEVAKGVKELNERLEPPQTVENTGTLEEKYSQSPMMLRR